MCIAGKKPHCEKLFVIGGASGRLIQVYVCIIYDFTNKTKNNYFSWKNDLKLLVSETKL